VQEETVFRILLSMGLLHAQKQVWIREGDGHTTDLGNFD
jgi:hypothetical protein